jgi:catechol 2,3-dioxygenase-like lactoylglutathione lyase family enzyme
MFSHVALGSNDLDRSKTFYDAIMGAIGGRPGFVDPKGRVVYSHNGANLLITTPIDGEPACHANGGTIGFGMANAEQAEAWHAAGVANGGTSIEDAPGIRNASFGDMFLAYLRDPDGNKLCAMHMMPKQ